MAAPSRIDPSDLVSDMIPGLESSDLWPHRSKPTRGDQGRGTAPVKTSQGWYEIVLGDLAAGGADDAAVQHDPDRASALALGVIDRALELGGVERERRLRVEHDRARAGADEERSPVEFHGPWTRFGMRRVS